MDLKIEYNRKRGGYIVHGAGVDRVFSSAERADAWAAGYEAGYAAHIEETTPKPLGELLKTEAA